MNDEAAFLASLAENPFDWLRRAIYADWLLDHGRYEDETTQRALVEGYAALQVLGRNPRHATVTSRPEPPFFIWTHWNEETLVSEVNRAGTSACLVKDWFDKCSERYPSRHEAEAAAALAFGLLPPERRAELLNPVGAA